MSDTQLNPVNQALPIASVEETLPTRQKRYTATYKLKLIEQADACKLPGQLASLLRKEGVYFSTLQDFKKQKARGALEPGQTAVKTSKQQTADSQTLKNLADSEKENRRLKRELEKTKALLDLQKKVFELMGLSLETQE